MQTRSTYIGAKNIKTPFPRRLLDTNRQKPWSDFLPKISNLHPRFTSAGNYSTFVLMGIEWSSVICYDFIHYSAHVYIDIYDCMYIYIYIYTHTFIHDRMRRIVRETVRGGRVLLT